MEHHEAEKLGMTHHSFKTVSSQLLLLDLIAEYLQFLDVIPSLAVEVAHRVVELVKVSCHDSARPLPIDLQSSSCILGENFSCYTELKLRQHMRHASLALSACGTRSLQIHLENDHQCFVISTDRCSTQGCANLCWEQEPCKLLG